MMRVEQAIAARSQARDKVHERDLRSIARTVKHALTEKRTAKRYAIETADQFVAVIDLDRMAMTALEQGAIDASYAGIDPGSRTVLFRFGAAFDHCIEIAIDMAGPCLGGQR